MLNGNVLKIAFLMIVLTLCGLLWWLTIGVSVFHLPLEDYIRLVGILGITGIFGGIIQAYIHANIADVSNKQANVAPDATVAQTKAIVEPTAEVKKP